MEKITLVTFLLVHLTVFAQNPTVTILSANGPGNTYEDINAVFAPDGGDVIESPGIVPDDCTNHADFDNGEVTNSNRHIQEVFDDVLNKNVFKFTLHVDEDIDRDLCGDGSRQRNEIKTYAPSPDYLKGVVGETVEYRWKFKIPSGFQASGSFTHIHQLKSVGGIESEERFPMITLTAYSSSGGRLVLRYSAQEEQNTVSDASIQLSVLENKWVEVVETVTYGYEEGVADGNATGSYAITISEVASPNTVLMSYSNNTNRFYKTDADFIRPKWGIYRSLAQSELLRDEEVLFADFQITETVNDPVLSNAALEKLKTLEIYPNPVVNTINFPFTAQEAQDYSIEITNSLGTRVLSIKLTNNRFDVSSLSAGVYFLKVTNINGKKSVIKKMIKI